MFTVTVKRKVRDIGKKSRLILMIKPEDTLIQVKPFHYRISPIY